MFMTSERGGGVDQHIEIEKGINPVAETLKYNDLNSQQIHHVFVSCLVWEAARLWVLLVWEQGCEVAVNC